MKQLLFIGLLAFTASCKKDANNLPGNPPSEIVAGVSPGSSTHAAPNLLIYKWSAGGENPTSYEIDLNSDGINDLRLSNSNGHPSGGLGISEQDFIETLNSDCFVVCDSIYQSGTYSIPSNTLISQTVVNELCPKVFSANETISIDNKWRQGKLLLSSWGSMPAQQNGYYFTSGYWTDLPQRHIAIRYKNFLGWIKISIVRTQEGLSLHEFACCKR